MSELRFAGSLAMTMTRTVAQRPKHPHFVPLPPFNPEAFTTPQDDDDDGNPRMGQSRSGLFCPSVVVHDPVTNQKPRCALYQF